MTLPTSPEKHAAPSKRRRFKRRRLLSAAAGALTLSALTLLALAWRPMGSAPQAERRARMEASPRWRGGAFENTLPLYNDVWGTLKALPQGSAVATPAQPPPTQRVDPASLRRPPSGGLRLTWLGHSTVLIQIDGVTLLTDPIWGPRASPWTFVGPKRWYEPLIALDDLPPLDAVLISHDHYDHLDYPTIQALASKAPRFIAPLGVGAHLEGWGVRPEQITELDWWQDVSVHDVTVTAAPSRHASGRHLLDQNRTLWTSFAVAGPTRRVYFSGDTGMTPEFQEIGQRLGPFDVTMIEIGAYHSAWPDWHIGPEQAVQAHGLLQGRALLPIHWGLLNMAMHGWTEPIERTVEAARRRGVALYTPKPGQPIEPATQAPGVTRWWPTLPWQTAQEHPVRATGLPAALVQDLDATRRAGHSDDDDPGDGPGDGPSAAP